MSPRSGWENILNSIKRSSLVRLLLRVCLRFEDQEIVHLLGRKITQEDAEPVWSEGQGAKVDCG